MRSSPAWTSLTRPSRISMGRTRTPGRSSTLGCARSQATSASTSVAVPVSRQPNISRSNMLRREEATRQMRCQIQAAEI